MKEFNKIMKVTRKVFLRTSVFSFFTNLLILALPIYMLQVFDRVIPGKSQETLIYLTLLALMVICVFGIIDILRSYLLTSLSFWLDKEINTDTLMRSADEVLQGDQKLFAVMTDTVFLRNYLSSTTFVVLFDIPWTPIYFIALFALHTSVGILALCGGGALFALAFYNDLATRQLISEANLAQIKTQANMTSMLRNAESIQAMGMQGAIFQRWDNVSTQSNDLLKLAASRSSFAVAASRVIRIMLQILILGLGAYLVTHDEFTPGMMIASSILMSRALSPLEQSIGAWREFIKAKDGYARIKEHITRPHVRQTTIGLPEPKGELSVEHVFFRFPKSDQWILQNIHLQLHPGEMLAIVGPSGAGKSTLARLIAGVLKPSQGHVRLDNAEIYHWDRQQFGEYVGYVAQNIELFDASVKDNIARMRVIDDKAVVKAAKLAGAHKLILHLSRGYDTQIGEQGRFLSGGQRQYVALARALYRDPKLLILDEPASFMDEHSQTLFLETLKRIKEEGITVLMITHKPRNIKESDKLLYLDKGKILVFGPTDEALKKLEEMKIKEI